MHNIPKFVTMLKERKFPVEGMRMEVLDESPDGVDGAKGIITLVEEDKFELDWCRWHCFLVLLSQLKWGTILKRWLPHCLLRHNHVEQFDVDSDRGRTLRVIRAIR